MLPIHSQLIASGRWQTLSLIEQMANIGSEVGRVRIARQRNDVDGAERAFARALELFDFTIKDSRHQGRRKEIIRARELFCDASENGIMYNTTLEDLDRYFLAFAYAAHNNQRP